MPDLVDRPHHLPIDPIVQNLPHKAAVDLQEIDREEPEQRAPDSLGPVAVAKSRD
jgi:hypothetical protein